MTMQGKTALLVGADGAVGAAVAAAFAEQGANVAVAASGRERGGAIAAVARARGVEVLWTPLDITDTDAVARLIAAVVSRFSRIDYACNSAVFDHAATPLHEIEEAVWDRIHAVALKAVWRCMRAELAQMLQQGGGAVVNMAAARGPAVLPAHGACCAAANGLLGLTQAAALEYGAHGIRVNAVCPGVIMAADAAADRETITETARAVVWLCSDAASYVTGEIVSLRGNG